MPGATLPQTDVSCLLVAPLLKVTKCIKGFNQQLAAQQLWQQLVGVIGAPVDTAMDDLLQAA